MVVLVAEDTELEVVGGGDIDSVVETEESIRVLSPTRIHRSPSKLIGCDWIYGQCRQNIAMELLDIYGGNGLEDRIEKISSTERSGELFRSKDRFKIV